MIESTSRAAVVLFCGDPRREERAKRLPPRFLGTLHHALLRMLRNVDADVFVERRRDTSLAEHIQATLDFCFDAGYARVLLLAGDVVDVTRHDLSLALRLLEQTSVIGPSGDGGFYLAGFNAPPDIEWERVLGDRSRACAALAEALEHHVTYLRRVDDVDSRGDAVRLVGLRPAFVARPRPRIGRPAVQSAPCGLRAPPQDARRA